MASTDSRQPRPFSGYVSAMDFLQSEGAGLRAKMAADLIADYVLHLEMIVEQLKNRNETHD